MGGTVESFLKLAGNVTVEWVVIAVAAIIFLVKVYRKVEDYFSKKAIAEREKDTRIHQVIEQAEQYPKWRQQSIDIQQQFAKAINDLKDSQERQNARLEKMEKEGQQRELNKIRDRILQSYRYYTSVEKNPQKAWSAMEADAFWRMFGDYENLGGDGYVHSDVQPAMNSLVIIQMDDAERLCELMHSRK